MTRIAVVGSREFPLMDAVSLYVHQELDESYVVVSGGAWGVDTVAVKAAQDAGYETEVIRADWSRYGKQAGMIRNRAMLETVDEVVAFWDGTSRGTRHAIETALSLPNVKKVTVFKS